MNRKTRLSVESYNRIFILGGKTLTYDQLKATFEKFGVITDIRMIKDSLTKENKGINYITFEKASEAALAIDKMNGQLIEGLAKPVKVVLANDRSEGNVRDPDEEEKMKRLFIIVPDGQTEDDLRKNFEKFGTLEYIKMLKKNDRGMQLAYVKFLSAYHAALALEECDIEYKAVFAETTWTTKRMRFGRNRRDDLGSDAPYRKKTRDDYDSRSGDGRYRGSGSSSVIALLAPNLASEQVYKLFDLLPGFQNFDYDPQTGSARATYSDRSYADRATEKLSAFEYPPGCPIQIRPSDPQESEGMSEALFNRPNFVGSNVEQNFKALVQTIEKATAMIQSSGYAFNNYNSSYECNPCQSDSLAHSSRPERSSTSLIGPSVASRLCFTSSPEMPPVSTLIGVFSQYGNLIDVDCAPGKQFGTASFATYEAALQAVKSLNDRVFCGNLLKVRFADPPAPTLPTWRSSFSEDRSQATS